MNRFGYRSAAGAAALIGLPMLGIWWAGYSLDRYLEFPPGGLHIGHAAFSWPVFITLALVEITAIVLAIRAGLTGSGRRTSTSPQSFPWWGWVGLAWTVAWWGLAWTRFGWFAPLQMHTFTPLWLGYIIVVNALTFRVSGRCLLTHATRYTLTLFPVSAAFWWFFEYLNRFVQNWTYRGVELFSPLEYFTFATMSFATVLPAVMSTDELLHAAGVASRADDRSVRPPGRVTRAFFFVASFCGLLFLGIAPNQLFPLLWLAPLGLLLLVQPLDFFPRVFPSVGTLLRLSLAALICGFFWELWNLHSLAKWIYHVPYVGRFHVFEMPILGFFGYLPFGWECAWLASMVPNNKPGPMPELKPRTSPV